MKRLLSVLAAALLLLVPFGSRENPIIPTFISELTIPDPFGWTLEIDAWAVDSLDDWVLITNSDTVGFQPGIVIGDGIVTVNANDLKRPVPLDMSGEHVRLRNGSSYSSVLYGPTGRADVNAPRPDQSINSLGYAATYYLDNSPTIGVPNDTVNATGMLRGTVRTATGDPIAGTEIDYHSLAEKTWTDSAGAFEIHDIAMIERLEVYHPGYRGTFTDVQIWPESTVTVQITLEPISSAADSPAGMERPTASLSGGYPNPFNSSTTIQFRVAREGLVILDIYTLSGEHVTNLVSELVKPGAHTVRWDPGHLPSGLYFARMKAGGQTMTRKLLLVR